MGSGEGGVSPADGTGFIGVPPGIIAGVGAGAPDAGLPPLDLAIASARAISGSSGIAPAANSRAEAASAYWRLLIRQRPIT